MRTRAQTARLGVFVAVAGAMLLGLLIVLSGTALLEQRDEYTIYFSETVSGLEVGAAVKLLGVRVGRIESFRVRPVEGVDTVDVKVSLDGGTPIRSDAEARLSGSGLTGLLFVEITGGTAEAPLIEPGGEIPAGPSLLGTLTGKAENIAIKTEEVLNRFLVLTEEENLENLRRTLDNVQATTLNLRNLSESLNGSVPKIVEAVDQLSPAVTLMGEAADAVRVAGQSTNDMMTELRAITRPDGTLDRAIEQVRTTLAAAEALLGGDKAAQLSADVRAAVTSFTETMNSLSTAIGSSESDVRDIASSLRDAAENLEEFARSIRENPSLLIRSTEE